MMESEILYGFKGEVPEGEYLVPIGKAAVRKAVSYTHLDVYKRQFYDREEYR